MIDDSGIASYEALRHVPLDFRQFHFKFHFRVDLTTNYTSIAVCEITLSSR